MKSSSSAPPGCLRADLAGQIDERVAALGDEHVAQRRASAGIAETQRRRRRGELRLDDRARLLGDAVAERDLALHAGAAQAVLRDVEQRRGDLARGAGCGAGAGRRRRGAPRRLRRAWCRDQRGRPTNSTQPDDQRRRRTNAAIARCGGIGIIACRCRRASRIADDAVDERLHERRSGSSSDASCCSCCGLVRKPISTSTAGMLAPTSTRNGACWIARGLIGTRSRSDASIARASAADCSMWRACAISHRMTSMSRVPPPNTGSASRCAARRALRLVAVSVEAQVEDLRAG